MLAYTICALVVGMQADLIVHDLICGNTTANMKIKLIYCIKRETLQFGIQNNFVLNG